MAIKTNAKTVKTASKQNNEKSFTKPNLQSKI